MSETHLLARGGPDDPDTLTQARCGHFLEKKPDPATWLPWSTDPDEVTCYNCTPRVRQLPTIAQILARAAKPRRQQTVVRIKSLITPENLIAYTATEDKLPFAFRLVDKEFMETFWTVDEVTDWFDSDRRDRYSTSLDQRLWGLTH